MKLQPLTLLSVTLFSVTAIGAEPVVTAGAGSYRTSAPPPCKPLPQEMFRTTEVTGPMITNQWWSSLVWQQFSQNMFAHPAFMRCDPKGLVLGYPGARIHGNGAGIFGSVDLQNGDLSIGHSMVTEFAKADCAGYSDWFVTAMMHRDDLSLKTTFGHGSPFVFCEIQGGDPRVTFVNAPKIWSGNAADAVLGVTVNGHHYGLFGETGARWEGLDGTQFTNVGRKHSYFSIAVLPNDQPETLRFFAKYAHAHVTSTRVEYQVDGATIRATYQFVCTPREGSETDTVFALYPHQWKYTDTELTELTYGSVRGTMKVGVGSKFTTSVPMQGVLPMLPRQGIGDSARMLDFLQAEAAKEKPGFADTYWEGKHLGTLASLSGIAEAAGAEELQREFVGELKRRLEDWFTATPDKEQPVFYYDANWGALIGSRPSYGSDRPLNDHHFHYGYFIRAAAEIARRDPEWTNRWGAMVNLLARDIASPDRTDPLFPHLRCFDIYAGHSWASGDANFADGNNQESSSESLNAWYGLILWGEATGNQQLRDLGLFLFNTERTAVEEYWFDVAGSNYPSDFPNVALGMVWGGKGAFGTWFSGEIDCIHGINWLPFTPASVYMGRHPEYVRKNYQQIVSKRKGGTDFNTGWGDLVLMFGALDDPTPAVAHLTAHPSCKIESGNSRAFMEHWIGTFVALGQIDATTTSAHPFTNVFVRNGKKSYAAYNYGITPASVTFSDGTQLRVPARSMAMGTDE
jgi:endoglucanase Acf2